MKLYDFQHKLIRKVRLTNIILIVIVMLTNFISKNYSLTNRILHTFAKFDRSKPHVNGKSYTI